MSSFSIIPASPQSLTLTVVDNRFIFNPTVVVPRDYIEAFGASNFEAWPRGTYEYKLANGSRIEIVKRDEPFSGRGDIIVTAYTPKNQVFFSASSSFGYDIEHEGVTFGAWLNNEGKFRFHLFRPYRDEIYDENLTLSLNEELQDDFLTGSGIGDPNAGGGIADEGGGDGDFDGSSDIIGIPGLPGISAVDTGFVTLYNPNTGQLKRLASYMWSTDFIDNVLKTMNDPIDAVLSLAIVPIAVPDGGFVSAVIGNVDTGIGMTKAAQQYVAFDCGTLNMHEFWGSALDYAPYTKAQIYLPYIGYRVLDVDEIMHKVVGVRYHVDILTGACVAYVHANGSVIYQWEGNCASFLPITGTNWSNIINAGLKIAGTAIGVASGGAATAATLASGLVNTAANVMSGKMIIEHGGNASGSGGMMSVQTPYLIVERPRQSLPASYNSFEGYPSNITSRLGDLSGYTAVESVHLEGINATDAELAEIESLLKGGVIL